MISSWWKRKSISCQFPRPPLLPITNPFHDRAPVESLPDKRFTDPSRRRAIRDQPNETRAADEKPRAKRTFDEKPSERHERLEKQKQVAKWLNDEDNVLGPFPGLSRILSGLVAMME